MTPRGKRARYVPSPIENEYCDRHGCLPDRHHDRMRAGGIPPAEASRIIQFNIEQCYAEMKRRNGQKEPEDCPFG